MATVKKATAEKAKLPFAPMKESTETLFELDSEGFDSAFEDLEPDSLCSNSSGKRLYERGWDSSSNSCNTSRESSEDRSTAENRDDDEQLREKMLSIAELWETGGLNEILKLDNVSVWVQQPPPQEKDVDWDSGDFGMELELVSILSSSDGNLLPDSDSIVASLMCEHDEDDRSSSPSKTVYLNIPDKWFTFQTTSEADKPVERKLGSEKKARRKLSFLQDDESIGDGSEIKEEMETNPESDLDDFGPLLNLDELSCVVNEETWIDPMWQVEPHNSLSLETRQDVTLRNVAEEMARGVLEDTPDGKKCDDCPMNCSQQFVHHAHKSCFKTVLPGSTRYDGGLFTSVNPYKKSHKDPENLLLSSKTHFKPISIQTEEARPSPKPTVEKKVTETTSSSGADVDEIEKDALESTEVIISEVDHEFQFLHNYAYDTSPQCPSIVKSVLEPLNLPDSPSYTMPLDENWVAPDDGYSLPSNIGEENTVHARKPSSIWECSSNNVHSKSLSSDNGGDIVDGDERREKLREECLQETENLFADIDCEVKWSALDYDSGDAVLPVDEELILQAYGYPQQVEEIELPFDLPSLPLDSDGRVLYSSELEENWKQNSQPFTVQVPKKNKNRPTSNKKACHYFLGGRCFRDIECRFSHDPASITCRFWEQESCLKGITCEFLHAYNYNPITTRRRQHSEGGSDRSTKSKDSGSRRRGRPRKHASFELTSHTDFPELSLAKDETEGSCKNVWKADWKDS